MLNIANFSENLNKNGVLSENRFDVSFLSPAAVRSAIPEWLTIDQMITLRAQQVSAPGVAVTSQSVVPYGIGITRKQPTNVEFTSNSITFLDDRNNTIYKYFYIWMNSLYDFTGAVDSGLVTSRPSYRVGYKKDNNGNNINLTNIRIHIYDYEGNTVTTALMENAYPTSVNDVSLDWNKTNSHFKVTVGFTFDRWYIENLSTISSFVPSVSQNAVTLENFVNPSSTLINGFLPGSSSATSSQSDGRLNSITPDGTYQNITGTSPTPVFGQ